MLTVDQIMDLNPCEDYPRERVEQLVNSGKSELEILLSLNYWDSRWLISRALNVSNRVAWAKACAARAAKYAEVHADATYAAIAAAKAAANAADATYIPDAANYAADAAYAARYAAADANYYAKEEHRKAIQHGLQLLK